MTKPDKHHVSPAPPTFEYEKTINWYCEKCQMYGEGTDTVEDSKIAAKNEHGLVECVAHQLDRHHEYWFDDHPGVEKVIFTRDGVELVCDKMDA